jgi:phosphatidylglycerophosphate synthase
MDGRIARKFGMVTDLGKVVDPAADKLTQAAMILCVSQKVPEMKILLVTLVVKELLMLLIGYLFYRKTNVVIKLQMVRKVNYNSIICGINNICPCSRCAGRVDGAATAFVLQ